MASLEEQVRLLNKAHDQNARTFQDCLFALEAQQWMMMRLVEDMMNGSGVKMTATAAEGGTVDWTHYESLYKTFVEEQRQLEEAAKAAEDDPDGAVIFGGTP